MSLSWFTVGAFLGGMALMKWILSYKIQALVDAAERAEAEALEAIENQKKVTHAAEEVVDNERTIDRAGELPRPRGLKLLLGDAKPGPRPPGGAA